MGPRKPYKHKFTEKKLVYLLLTVPVALALFAGFVVRPDLPLVWRIIAGFLAVFLVASSILGEEDEGPPFVP